jgi:hypothetical protein
MMRNFVLIGMLICVFEAKGQLKNEKLSTFPKHEISLGYTPPYYSGFEIGLFVTEGFIALANNISKLSDNSVVAYTFVTKSTGTPCLTYRFRSTNRWSFTGSFGYNNLKYQRVATDSTARTLYKANINSFFLTGGAEFHYFKKKRLVDLYSGMQMSYRFNKSTSEYLENHILIKEIPYDIYKEFYHINIIGIRVGKKFGAFLELGFGMNGLVKSGFSYRF